MRIVFLIPPTAVSPWPQQAFQSTTQGFGASTVRAPYSNLRRSAGMPPANRYSLAFLASAGPLFVRVTSSFINGRFRICVGSEP